MKKIKISENTAYIIKDEAQRMYFTGFKSSFGYVVVTEEERAFFTDKRYFFAAKERFKDANIIVYNYENLNQIKEYLISKGVKTLGIDCSLTTLDEGKELKKLGFEIININKILDKAFAIKSKADLKNISKACDVAQKAFYEVLPFVKKGITEKQLANELEYKMLLLGAEKTSFDTIVAFGENSAVPHHETGDKVLEENMPILIDFGCKVNGFCSDCTRTFYYGEPNEEFMKAYNSVLNANVMAEEEIEEGFTCKQADAVARDLLTKDGYGEYFTHSLGHGIGINVHEYPYLAPRFENDVLKDGMVFSIEPGVYFDGKFGIRIEDTVTMFNGKVKRLFTDDKKIIKINI